MSVDAKRVSRLGILGTRLLQVETLEQVVTRGSSNSPAVPGSVELIHSFGTADSFGLNYAELARVSVQESGGSASYSVSCAATALRSVRTLTLDPMGSILNTSLHMEGNDVTGVGDIQANSISSEHLKLETPLVSVSNALEAASLKVHGESVFDSHDSATWNGTPEALVHASAFRVQCPSASLSFDHDGLVLSGNGCLSSLELVAPKNIKLSAESGALEATCLGKRLFSIDEDVAFIDARVVPKSLVLPLYRPDSSCLLGEICLDKDSLRVSDGTRDLKFTESCWNLVNGTITSDVSVNAPHMCTKHLEAEAVVSGSVSTGNVFVNSISNSSNSCSIAFGIETKAELQVRLNEVSAMRINDQGIFTEVPLRPEVLVCPMRMPVQTCHGATFFDPVAKKLSLRGNDEWVDLAPCAWSQGASDSLNFPGTVSATNLSCAQISAQTLVAESVSGKQIHGLENIGDWMSIGTSVTVNRPLQVDSLSLTSTMDMRGNRIIGASSFSNGESELSLGADEIDIVIDGLSVMTFSKNTVGCSAVFHPESLRIPIRAPTGDNDGTMYFERSSQSLCINNGSTWTRLDSSWQGNESGSESGSVSNSIRTHKCVSIGGAFDESHALAVSGATKIQGTLEVSETVSASSLSAPESVRVLVGTQETMEITPGYVDIKGTLEVQEILLPTSATDGVPSTCNETEGSMYFGGNSKRLYTFYDGAWTLSPARVPFEYPKTAMRGDLVFDEKENGLRIFDGLQWKDIKS